METRIVLSNGTPDVWATYNPIMRVGEIGFEKQDDGSYKIKVGDGLTHWNDLGYAVDFQAIAAALKSAQDAAAAAATSEANAAATLANAVQNTVQIFTDDQKRIARENIGVYGTPGGFSFSMAADKSMVVGYTDPITHEVYAPVTPGRDTTGQELVDATTLMAGYMKTIAEMAR